MYCNIVVEFGRHTNQVRLIKMCLDETYIYIYR